MANQVSAEQVQQELWSAGPVESARSDGSKAASSQGADSATFDSAYFDRLRDEARRLTEAGCVVVPIICKPQDANRYPQIRNGKPVLDTKTGVPKPDFGGKNPSYWMAAGEPTKLSHGKPPALPKLLAQITTAEQLGKPLGIAFVPSPDCVAIDFDAKDYVGGAPELAADVERLLSKHPELGATRRESTPSGGQHFYVSAGDGMASWQKASGKGHHCNFSTADGGPHRGEVLVGVRVCVTWPTPGYSLLSPEHAHTFVEVANLAAIGITPCSGRQKAKPEPRQAAAKPAPRQHSSSSQVPQLADLLGKMAQKVLNGGRPYDEDRSSNLAGFMRELYIVLNWLEADGLAFDGSENALIEQAVTALDIEDKADRVIETIDRADCQLRADRVESLRKRYRFLSGDRVKTKPAVTKAADNADQHQPDSKPPASWADLIGRLPDGWVVTEQGTFPSKLSAGQLARMLEREQSLIRYNELTMFCEVYTLRGWCAVVDAELDSAYVLLSQMGWIIGAEPITKAVCHVARLCSFHPVKQYLLALEEKPSVEAFNLDEVAPKFFRADKALHVAMVRKWLIGAVARAMNPGCQMDYCLVLQSRRQGLMKSTSFRDLASPDWFTSTVPDADKDFLLNVHSCWIFELAELESVTGKRDAGRLKNLITTSVDTFRVPYGRTAERRLRGSVFCGTVNEDSFLKDPTGNRRYWVVPIEGSDPLDRDGLKSARDGIWKAAMAAWRAGELPMLNRAQEALSEIQNETFVQSDPWLAMLDIAITERPHQWRKPFSTADALLAAKLKNEEQISRADESRIAPLLRRLGFEKAKNPATTDDGKRVRLWSTAQPAQPCTTPNSVGCAPPEALQQNGSERAAQPAQPIHSERLKKELVKRGSVADPWCGAPYVGEMVVQFVQPPPRAIGTARV